MLEKKIVVSWLVLALANSISAEYNVNGVCTVVTDGLRIGSIDSCQRYYTCNNGIATPYDCPSGSSFSKDVQDCVAESEFQCTLNLSNPCTGADGTFVQKSGTCNGWIYCKNGKEAGSGSCANNLIFSDGVCKFGSCSTVATALTSNFTTICQIMKNNKYFGSTKQCGKWQVCRNNKLVTGFCKDGLAYDVKTGSCVLEADYECAQVTGITIQPDVESYGTCTTDGNIKATSICSDYLKCENNVWKSYSCSTNYYYDITTETCVLRSNAKTYDCDRCQFSKSQFVNAVDTTCRKYLVCENGVKKSVNTCADGYYFDETAEACIKGTGTDSAAANNACYVA
uniref:Peritrophin-48 n=1 Tax=Bactrocera dorsalis TaxID=27457 RepID=A0A034WNJ1_BACDO